MTTMIDATSLLFWLVTLIVKLKNRLFNTTRARDPSRYTSTSPRNVQGDVDVEIQDNPGRIRFTLPKTDRYVLRTATS